MSVFRPRDVRVYRPYPDEVPWDLLAEADEPRLREAMEENLLRVGKLGGEVLGAYALQSGDGYAFELVTLVVARGWRRKGLGRWLLGHAIGLTETKGGREVIAAAGGLTRSGEGFLVACGFERDGETLRLALTPE